MTIDVEIDRIVVEGLSLTPGGASAFQRAFERELGRLLASGAWVPELAHGAALPTLPSRPVAFASPSNPRAMGQEVARAVYGSLGAS